MAFDINAPVVFATLPNGYEETKRHFLEANEGNTALGNTMIAMCLGLKGVRSGPENAYRMDENGKFYLAQYACRENNKREGKARAYFEDGKTLATAFEYKNDRVDGLLTEYTRDGEIEAVRFFKAGIEDEAFAARYAEECLTLEFVENAALVEKNERKMALANTLVLNS